MSLQNSSTASYINYSQHSVASAPSFGAQTTARDDSQMSIVRNMQVHIRANVLPGAQPYTSTNRQK
jgi:hypothetical protein